MCRGGVCEEGERVGVVLLIVGQGGGGGGLLSGGGGLGCRFGRVRGCCVACSCELVPHEPAAEGVGCDEGEADGRAAEDGVPEDVEHVVAVVGEREGVDDGVIFDDG